MEKRKKKRRARPPRSLTITAAPSQLSNRAGEPRPRDDSSHTRASTSRAVPDPSTLQGCVACSDCVIVRGGGSGRRATTSPRLVLHLRVAGRPPSPSRRTCPPVVFPASGHTHTTPGRWFPIPSSQPKVACSLRGVADTTYETDAAPAPIPLAEVFYSSTYCSSSPPRDRTPTPSD